MTKTKMVVIGAETILPRYEDVRVLDSLPNKLLSGNVVIVEGELYFGDEANEPTLVGAVEEEPEGG